jgi:hypothetical protein
MKMLNSQQDLYVTAENKTNESICKGSMVGKEVFVIGYLITFNLGMLSRLIESLLILLIWALLRDNFHHYGKKFYDMQT